MANPSNDPELAKMMNAWEAYAKKKGYVTQNNKNGVPPEDKDVMNFITRYFRAKHGYKLQQADKDALKAMIDSFTSALSGQQSGFLRDIRSLIRHKLSKKQIEQLRWELENV